MDMNMIDPKYKDYLVRMGAGETPHSGRTLYDHLAGVYGLLKRWNNPEPVCLAGLFHSVYGTSAFKKQTIAFSARDEVRALIGDEAESLAYLFCVCERYSSFTALLYGQAELKNHASGECMPVDVQTLGRLLEMEIANLVDHLPDLTIRNAEPKVEKVLNAYLLTMRASASEGAFRTIETVCENSFRAHPASAGEATVDV